MINLAVVILTYNEEQHIERAIKSVKGFAAQVIVIDSYSNDKTVELAELCGAVVLKNTFINQAKQFQWALDNAPIKADWIMRLDADEVVEKDLSEEIATRLPTLGKDVVAVNLKRKHVFMGRWIRFGGRYPLILTRIWRRGMGRVEDRWMDEHVIVWGGRTVLFEGGFADINLNDITFFVDKHNKYATREAVDVYNQRRNLFARDTLLAKEGASFQASIKRRLKEGVYNRVPFHFSSLAYFLYRYVFQLGFLDGKEGLIYHFLQGYWYRFLAGAKLVELERETKGITDPVILRQKIAELTGLQVN